MARVMLHKKKAQYCKCRGYMNGKRYTYPGRSVFENIEDYKLRIDEPDLPVDENSILALKNVGPKGYPGIPEVGNMTLPVKLLKQGVKDLIRISDGRMSGTGFGIVVLHISPEASLGANFSVIQTGDMITLNVLNRLLTVDLSDQELQVRKDSWKLKHNLVNCGYSHLFIREVEQAHLGMDFGFLKGDPAVKSFGILIKI